MLLKKKNKKSEIIRKSFGNSTKNDENTPILVKKREMRKNHCIILLQNEQHGFHCEKKFGERL
jgi:hypothetical protein